MKMSKGRKLIEEWRYHPDTWEARLARHDFSERKNEIMVWRKCASDNSICGRIGFWRITSSWKNFMNEKLANTIQVRFPFLRPTRIKIEYHTDYNDITISYRIKIIASRFKSSLEIWRVTLNTRIICVTKSYQITTHVSSFTWNFRWSDMKLDTETHSKSRGLEWTDEELMKRRQKLIVRTKLWSSLHIYIILILIGGSSKDYWRKHKRNGQRILFTRWISISIIFRVDSTKMQWRQNEGLHTKLIIKEYPTSRRHEIHSISENSNHDYRLV